MTVDPRFLEVDIWTADVSSTLAQYGQLPTIANEQDWQAWAAAARSLPALAALGIPDPRMYREWKDWAFQFNAAVAVLGI